MHLSRCDERGKTHTREVTVVELVHSRGAGWRDSARPKARVSATRDGAAEEPWSAFPDAVRVSVDPLLREIHQCALDEKSTLSKVPAMKCCCEDILHCMTVVQSKYSMT